MKQPDLGNKRFVIQDYYRLTQKLFRLGARDMPRGGFFREVFVILLDAVGCDGAEFRLRIGDFEYYGEMAGPPNPVFRFGIVDRVPADGKIYAPGGPDTTPVGRYYADVRNGKFNPRQVYFASKGSSANVDLSARAGEQGSGDDERGGPAYLVGDGFEAAVVVPFVIGEGDQGLLLLKSRRPGFFTRDEAELFESIAHNIGVAIEERRTHWKLRERVKEMTCLYGIAEVASRPGIGMEELFREIVRLLPPAMQYPVITVGKITVDGEVYATEEAADTPYRLSAEVVVRGQPRGAVEVQYQEAKSDYEPGVFLREERNLLDAIARQIGLVLENRLAEEDRDRLREQLRHADRLATIGQLAAGVAHELNEPLEIILGFSQLMPANGELSPQAARDLEKILSASLRARDIVKKLLIFARQMPTIKRGVDLGQIAAEALSLLESRLDKENIALVRQFAPKLPELTADPGQLHQVVVNLVVNAFQAMPGGGTLTVGTRADDEFVYLVVEDTGVGIPDDIRTSIFLPFFTTKEVGQGTGLGLAVVYGIVTAHGGTVNVESEPGRGSRFEVRLPFGARGGGEDGVLA